MPSSTRSTPTSTSSLACGRSSPTATARPSSRSWVDARGARRNLPVGLPADDALVELRVPVPDREGVIAEVTTLAARLGVNIADLEIAHSLEGRAGVLVLVVAERGVDAFEAALVEHGYHVARTSLG